MEHMKPGAWSTHKLAADAAAMEARLAALKTELQKDKARREAAMATAIHCSCASMPAIARASSTGRSGSGAAKHIGKQLTHIPSAKLPSNTSTRSRSSTSMHQTVPRPLAPDPCTTTPQYGRSNAATPERPSSCSSMASSRSSSSTNSGLDTKNSDTSTKSYTSTASHTGHKLSHIQLQKQQHQGLGSCSASSTPAACSTGADTGCAADSNQHQGSLLHGAFDEDAGRNSFQEAVRQWREAGAAAACTSAPCSSSSGTSSSIAGHMTDARPSCKDPVEVKAQGTTVVNVQTEPPRSSRPVHQASMGSSLQDSDALVANRSVAAFLQRLCSRNSGGVSSSDSFAGGAEAVYSSLPGGSCHAVTCSPDNTCSRLSNAGSFCSSPRMPTSQTNRHVLSCNSSCEAGTAVAAPPGDVLGTQLQAGGSSSSSTPAAKEGDASSSSESPADLHQDTPSSPLPDDHHDADCLEAFDGWLQQTEHIAAALVDSACQDRGPEPYPHGHDGLAATSAGHGLTSTTAAAAAGDYHERLQHVLEGLQMLEVQLQQADTAQPSTVKFATVEAMHGAKLPDAIQVPANIQEL